MLKARERVVLKLKTGVSRQRDAVIMSPVVLNPLPQRHGREMMNEKMGNKRLEILCPNRIEPTSALLVYVVELHREVCFLPLNS